MAVELTPGLTPLTVANFLAYVDDGFFDGLIFHRVIENFMVQGGGFDDEMNEKPARDPIPLERSGVSNRRGTIAMARTNHPDSAASEFFINHADNKFLDSRSDHAYCAFGLIAGDEAAASLATLDAIARVATHTVAGGLDDVPVAPVYITRVYRAASPRIGGVASADSAAQTRDSDRACGRRGPFAGGAAPYRAYCMGDREPPKLRENCLRPEVEPAQAAWLGAAESSGALLRDYWRRVYGGDVPGPATSAPGTAI
ncbi:peptidyl-prolyl cis-trans isomerase [Aureococcus anophagefferens]|nr:peptidyl-prolyl cis-trans isomerase [Aureococcus anophagefferens]